jgi:hypothetical protein
MARRDVQEKAKPKLVRVRGKVTANICHICFSLFPSSPTFPLRRPTPVPTTAKNRVTQTGLGAASNFGPARFLMF